MIRIIAVCVLLTWGVVGAGVSVIATASAAHAEMTTR
jgi:hypothetical protein